MHRGNKSEREIGVDDSSILIEEEKNEWIRENLIENFDLRTRLNAMEKDGPF